MDGMRYATRCGAARSLRRCRGLAYRPATVLVLAVAACLLAGNGSADLLSEENIRDALIGRQPSTEGRRMLMDVNADGLLDSADLVTFLRIMGLVPTVSFRTTNSTVSEGAGTVAIPVEFSRAFSGTLHYAVMVQSTALAGEDFAPVSGAVDVDGTSGLIEIDLIDDVIVEPMQCIVVELLGVEGAATQPGYYAPAAPTRHTVFISDNDVLWRGVLNLTPATIGFGLEIRTNGVTTQAVLRSDGVGVIPASDPPEAGWPVQSIEFTDTHFEATAEAIPVPAGQTSEFGARFTRTFRFHAAATDQAPPAEDALIFNPAATIMGVVEEDLIAVEQGAGHWTRTLEGHFTLNKSVPVPDVPEPTLEESY